MSRSIFGWSYPPGCSGPPEDEEGCETCLCPIDDCVCAECPTCGEFGNPRCYILHPLHNGHGMLISERQVAARLNYLRRTLSEREAERVLSLEYELERKHDL